MKTENLILPLIAERRSELSFQPVILPDEILMNLFEASRWSPSAFNEQPWNYFLGNRKNPESFSKVLSLLAPPNQEWAKNASALVISSANGNNSKNGSKNYYALHDLGMATFSLVGQAQAMGLVTHLMGGFDHQKARELLNIPDEQIIGAAIAIGYKGENTNLPPVLYERMTSPRVRKGITDFVINV